MIPRSPRIELGLYGFILGFMILSGLQVQGARADCIHKHGTNYSLTPSDAPLRYDCQPGTGDNMVRNPLFQALSLILVHVLPFGMGYRAKTLIQRLQEDD